MLNLNVIAKATNYDLCSQHSPSSIHLRASQYWALLEASFIINGEEIAILFLSNGEDF